jgi:RecB family endonuclease NucS
LAERLLGLAWLGYKSNRGVLMNTHNTQHCRDLGAHYVMKILDLEKAAATADEKAQSDLNRYVEMERERDRQI